MSLAGDILPAVMTQLLFSRPDVTNVQVGAEFLREEDGVPRIVFVQTEDSFEFGKRITAEVGQAASTGVPRSIGTRNAGVNVHIWDVDFPAVELLIDQVIAACRVIGHGTFKVKSGFWVGRETGEQVMQFGRLYVMAMEWQVPVLLGDDAANVATTFQHVDQDTGMTFPDGHTVHGDPSI